MNNIAFDHRTTIPISMGNMTKINPFSHQNNSITLKNSATRRKYFIPNSNREFGKEINIPTNLTTCNNRESINSRKTLGIPFDPKMKRDPQYNQIKRYHKISINKRRKDGPNSLNKKPNDSFDKSRINKSFNERVKKEVKINNKNMSQKNILYNHHHTVCINDDIIMKDENINPNIIAKVYSSNRDNTINTINRNSNAKSGANEDIEMKIENIVKEEIKVKKKINIQNADEYFDEICEELLNNEEKYLVNPEYMKYQSDINHKMRAILIDWLIDVHLKYKLVPQTIYIAVNLLDRYLSKNDTDRTKLQLVGVTAMFIACKYEEIYPPDLKDFVYITDGAYVKSDVLHLEHKMLKSLNFDITFPTQWSIFEIYKKKLDLNEKCFKLAWFLMELCLINIKSLKFKMSVLAASAIIIALKTLGVFNSNLFYKAVGYDEKDLEECCKVIYDFYIYNSTHHLKAIRRKFSSSKFDEVAKIKII